jgi:hypothetical protein
LAGFSAPDIAARTAELAEADLAETTVASAQTVGELDLPANRLTDPETLTRGEMLALVTKYENDIQVAKAQAEDAFQSAYRNKDIIKVTCVREKLVEIKAVIANITERFTTLRNDERKDDLHVRGEFSIIEQGRRRILELRREIDVCIGEDLSQISTVSFTEEPSSTAGIDPTGVPSPIPALGRPPEASPYK